MDQFSQLDLAVLILGAFLIGASKAGLAGANIIVVPMAAMIMPAKMSLGIVLAFLITADLFAIHYYRKKVQWKHIAKLLPATFCGVIAGYYAIGRVDDQKLYPIIGTIIIVSLILNFVRTKIKNLEKKIPHQLWFAVILGFIVGVTSVMANVGSAVAIIYFLVYGLSKDEFIPTAAWFFCIVNWIKLPLYIKGGLLTISSLQISLIMLPVILIGGLTGLWCLKRINQTKFNCLVQLASAAAAIKLLF